MARFTDAYLESCREARLRRSPGRVGREALRLDPGDLYAWREGVPASPGAIRLSQIDQPRTVFIVDGRLWWVPRLDQLLDRLETTIRRRESALGPRQAREWVARRLAERMREREWSWEEAALALLIDQR